MPGAWLGRIAACTEPAVVVEPTRSSLQIPVWAEPVEADAMHKLGLINTVAKKGPKAIQATVDAAAKAEKRWDVYAKKLSALGVVIEA